MLDLIICWLVSVALCGILMFILSFWLPDKPITPEEVKELDEFMSARAKK